MQVVEDDDYLLVKRVAFDCIPAPRRRLLDSLVSGDHGEAGAASTLSYVRQEWAAIEQLTPDGALSDFSRDLLRQAAVL